MISGKKEDVFYTDDEYLVAISRKVCEDLFYRIGYSFWSPKTTEDPYAIREITDERFVTVGDKKVFNNTQITLSVPDSWKCFTASGEDDVAYYFKEPVLGEKCQLRVNVTFAHYYSGKELTQENYLNSLSRSYEDVAIESLTKETIRGYACTKVVYSYTEDNTKFIGIWYDSLIEGPRLYHFRIRYPAEEREAYEKAFAAIMDSVRFLQTGEAQITVSDEFIATCNLNSGGYINYLNGKYYYRNTEGNKLFMCDADGKNAVCIDNCPGATLLGITVDETVVYYLKKTKLDTPLEFHNFSVSYSIPFEGQLRRYCDGKVTVLSEENVVDYALSKEYIFYTTADQKVYRMKHDGTEKTAIIESTYPNICVSENKLYTHMGEGVWSTDFDGKNSLTVRAYHFELAASEAAVYFISADDGSLNKMSLNGETKHMVIRDPIRSFTVYNGRLVYERMYTDDIVIADMDGSNPKVVCPGAHPIALNGHLFYLDDNGAIKVADI